MANQIQFFGMSQMTIGSCSDFHTRVNNFITTATPAALHIESQAAAYATAVETLASIVNRERAFVSTQALREADKVRDSASGVISQVVNAYLTSPVSEKQSAARLLDAKMSPYRGIRNHEYTKQTAEVRGMLAMLDAESDAVSALGLDAEVEALREANGTFDTQYYSRTAEASTRMAQSTVKSDDVVAQANSLYLEIVQIVNAYAIVQPSDELDSFIGNVNGLVASYSRISGSSTTGSGGTGTPDGEAPEPSVPDDEEEDGGSPDPIV